MATLNVYSTSADGFYNNISSAYDGEDFNLSSTTSSSDAVYNVGIMFFDTRGSTHSELVGATINSITLYYYVTNVNDVNVVGEWTFYQDPTNHWGDTVTSAWTSSGFPSYGTYTEGTVYANGFTVSAWNTKSLTADNDIITYGCRVAIECGASDLGPAEMFFTSTETAGSYDPYVVIDYTPASSGPRLLAMTGVGK